MQTSTPSYLLAGATPELERLRVQSRVWEPAGRALLAGLALPDDARVLDVGCGVLGWLGVLAERFPAGEVVGTDLDEAMLAAAAPAVAPNVRLVRDDLFDSALPAGSFDLVHARFQLCPLGRPEEQVAAYRRLLRPGGVLVLEDPDTTGWGLTPDAPGCGALMDLVRRAFLVAGGDLDMGRRLPAILRAAGLEAAVTADIVALEPGHPYLRMPLQFAASLEPRLVDLAGAAEVSRLRALAEDELSDGRRWGTTFTLVQTTSVDDRV